jgi:molecular chaperone DnaK
MNPDTGAPPPENPAQAEQRSAPTVPLGPGAQRAGKPKPSSPSAATPASNSGSEAHSAISSAEPGAGSTPAVAQAAPRTAAAAPGIHRPATAPTLVQPAGTAPGLPPVRAEMQPPSASQPQESSADQGSPPPSAAERDPSEPIEPSSSSGLRTSRARSWSPSIAPLPEHAAAARAPANDGSESVVVDPAIFLSESQLLRSQFPGPPSHAPLLLDVTPHTLSVETAGGFCEPVVERNAPIPTEQTRVFSTSQDDQVTVSVRVCQGESRRTDENQSLGQIQLLGLRPARRGEVSIAVTFIIDADGTLNVKAIDRTTGQGQAIRVDLVGAIGERELERMRERQHGASLRPRAAP